MSLAIQLERTALQPGETVEGTVTWSDAGPAETVAISLLWFTEGKGSEDSEVVARHEVPSPAAHGSEHFAFQLPAFPWSASGKLVSIVWAVEASLDPDGDVAVARLVSAPDGVERVLGTADADADAAD